MKENYPIEVANAPTPLGPYSQGMRYGEMIFISGQLGISLESGELVAPDAAGQARQALEYLQNILISCGSATGRVLKTTIFLTDLADFTAVNKVYEEFFAFHPPARSCVQVAALPKGAAVEIEAIACAPTEETHGIGGPGF